jgi:hypothetical protein
MIIIELGAFTSSFVVAISLGDLVSVIFLLV